MVCSCSRRVYSDRQSLWHFFFAGIFHDQDVITCRRQTPSQLHADLQQKKKTILKTQFKLQFSLFVWNTNTHAAQTLPLLSLTHIISAADSHVGVAWGDPLTWAGARQVVVVDTAGVVAGDEGEGVQRQISVQQTARQTQREQTGNLKHGCFCFLCECRKTQAPHKNKNNQSSH